MQDAEILELLFELARDAGMQVRIAGRRPAGSEEPPLASGVCRVRGKVFVVLSGGEPVAAQIEVMAGALRKHAGTLLEERHLPPAVRARIEPSGRAPTQSA